MTTLIEDVLVDDVDVAKPGLRDYLAAREVLMPEDYGAVGNGVADDTAAIQDWIDAGGRVIIAGVVPRIYKITGKISLSANTHYDFGFRQGEGVLTAPVFRYVGTGTAFE